MLEDDELRFQVYDEDPGADDLVGEGMLKIEKCYIEKRGFWMSLSYADKSAGELALEIQFLPLDKQKIEKTRTLQSLIKEKGIKLAELKKEGNQDVEIINNADGDDDEIRKELWKSIELDKFKIAELENELQKLCAAQELKIEDEMVILGCSAKKVENAKRELTDLNTKLTDYSK